MYRTTNHVCGKFGLKHDMRSDCPLTPETLVRVRVAGLDHTFVGEAREFHWRAPESINPLQPWLVDTSLPGIPEDCYFAQSTVVEYRVLTSAELSRYPPFQ